MEEKIKILKHFWAIEVLDDVTKDTVFKEIEENIKNNNLCKEIKILEDYAREYEPENGIQEVIKNVIKELNEVK